MYWHVICGSGSQAHAARDLLNSVHCLAFKMQGRTNKTLKKELVIESPQQYKNTASCEGEVETVVQVLVSKHVLFS